MEIAFLIFTPHSLPMHKGGDSSVKCWEWKLNSAGRKALQEVGNDLADVLDEKSTWLRQFQTSAQSWLHSTATQSPLLDVEKSLDTLHPTAAQPNLQDQFNLELSSIVSRLKGLIEFSKSNDAAAKASKSASSPDSDDTLDAFVLDLDARDGIIKEIDGKVLRSQKEIQAEIHQNESEYLRIKVFARVSHSHTTRYWTRLRHY